MGGSLAHCVQLLKLAVTPPVAGAERPKANGLRYDSAPVCCRGISSFDAGAFCRLRGM
jgi:hypothetical protein